MYEALQQIHVYQQEITGLTESLTSMSIALEEAKEHNASLDATIREMKITPAMCVDGHGRDLEFNLVSMEMLSKARIAQSMKQSEIWCALTCLPILLLLFIRLEPHLPSKFIHYCKV
jgi:hypothetical protein